MQTVFECPCCMNKGLNVELDAGKRLVTTGHKLSEYPFVTICKVCKRKIRYDVISDSEGK